MGGNWLIQSQWELAYIMGPIRSFLLSGIGAWIIIASRLSQQLLLYLDFSFLGKI